MTDGVCLKRTSASHAVDLEGHVCARLKRQAWNGKQSRSRDAPMEKDDWIVVKEKDSTGSKEQEERRANNGLTYWFKNDLFFVLMYTSNLTSLQQFQPTTC